MQLNRDKLLIHRKPRHLLARLLNIALEVQLKLQTGNSLMAGWICMRDLANNCVAPVHQRDPFVLGERGPVGLFEDDGGAEDYPLLAKVEFSMLFFQLPSSSHPEILALQRIEQQR
jgi:hypothetical protein